MAQFFNSDQYLIRGYGNGSLLVQWSDDGGGLGVLDELRHGLEDGLRAGDVGLVVRPSPEN